MRRPRAVTALLLATALSTLTAREANANGRFPAAGQIAVQPGAPAASAVVLVRATFGLLVSKDGGASFAWICESAFGLEGEQDPRIAVTTTGALIEADDRGLGVSRDGGCSWERPIAQEPVLDVTLGGRDGRDVLALVGSRAGQTASARVVISRDDGKTFEDAGPRLPREAIDATALEAEKTEPGRVIVSSLKKAGAGLTGALFTLERGAWSAVDVPLEPGERAPYIAAIEETLTLVRVAGQSMDRLVAVERGRARTVLKQRDLLAFAWDARARRAFVGGPSMKVQSAAPSAFDWTPILNQPARAMALSGDQALLCGADPSALVVRRSLADAMAPAVVIGAGELKPIACNASTTGARCAAAFPALAARFGLAVDAGAAPAPSSIAPETPAPRAKSCACSLPARDEPAPTALAIGGLLVAAMRAATALARRRRCSSS